MSHFIRRIRRTHSLAVPLTRTQLCGNQVGWNGSG